MNARTVRWGIVGPGRIADKVVLDFAHVPGAEVVAVASRSPDRAAAFARKHGIPRAHGSYAAIVADPEVDVLYIATPHRQHHQIAIAAIHAGKALLIEKAFTATVPGAEEIAALARAKKVFVMEAMWTRFQPILVKARELIASGAIGEVRGVQADLGVDRPYDPKDRLFDLAQGGGAMLDLGVYVISFAQMFLGDATKVLAQGSITGSGVDAEAGILLEHGAAASGITKRSVLLSTLRNATPGQARIFGSTGWLDFLPRFHHPTQMQLNRRNQSPETFTLPPLGAGYSHELIEVTECLRAGKTESAVMPLDDTLAVQRVMNSACEQIGVFHTEEK